MQSKKGHVIKNLILSFFVTYGLFAVVPYAIRFADYDSLVDYALDSIYAILGDYNFLFCFGWLLAFLFVSLLKERYETSSISLSKGENIVSVALSIIFCISEVLKKYSTISALYSAPSVIVFLLKMIGFSYAIKLVLFAINNARSVTYNIYREGFLTKGTFTKAFAILILAYAPIIALSYPGNVCYDTMGQIWQVTGDVAFSAHHPILSTLLIGGVVKAGSVLFGSYKLGLFIYVILQDIMLSGALAFTLSALNRQKVKSTWLNVLLCIYIFTPIYSNIVSTAIKDVPFIAAFISYIVILSLILKEPECLDRKSTITAFITFAVLTCLLRNNGLYEVALTGIIITLVLLFKKEYDTRYKLKIALIAFVIPVLIAMTLNAGIKIALQAKEGGRAEALSLPMQITARYISQYPDDISDGDVEKIETVFGDYLQLGVAYHPELSDYVKQYFDNSSSVRDTVSYLTTIPSIFVKHPTVVIDAVLIHTYGWISPNVSTAARYEIYDLEDMQPVKPEGVFLTIRKVLIFFYRFLDRMSVLGLLQNVGFATWILIYLTVVKEKHNPNVLNKLILIPLWIGLLICFASPGFTNHTRYGFPILFTIPYLIFYFSGRTDDDERTV